MHERLHSFGAVVAVGTRFQCDLNGAAERRHKANRSASLNGVDE
jgi:hypothetical protein